ncbi:VOC family protein [Candidatus Halobonum tyrrellensis]|uniref:Glyoxalase/bleomycin resistance protein/dioxygenase n=1 Tax=Candidatus Halobonum tyrrellensis G22 TaxID=1324957 RepID=V4J0M4_9EURY|nr:VOC family protein [Candidatus Halobonum tyrrellensis]ESP89022.1 Glyoxalase/bleomycin resistance protein/dioxygenase [Candidatus Halobonum tyrrellensis G22]
MSAASPPPALAHLALEVSDLDRAARFYADRLGLVPSRRSRTELAFDVGGTDLVCRRPRSVPRGGLHVHFAFETPAREYDAWRARFPDAEEVSFDSFRSLYPFDDDGHCPEVGGVADGGAGLVGVFEVVLEVANLDDTERTYRALGFEPVDRGVERRRVRLRGPAGADRPFDLELWEPQVGLAGARGGVHVDIGVRLDDPAAAAERAFGDAPAVRPLERPDGSVELYDADGHHLLLYPTDRDGAAAER